MGADTSSDKFTITADPARALLRVVLRGHWSVDTVADYKRAMVETVTRLHARIGSTRPAVALVDLRATGPQSQDVVNAYREALGGGELVPARLATLISSALLKRQAERIAVPNQRFFTDEAEAMAWLFSPDPAA